jgi:hypothetical protein
LTETLGCFLPGRAKDLPAPLYRGSGGVASHIEQKCLVEYYWPTTPVFILNPLTSNDHYSGRTTSLTSKRCILCIYSTNMGTEYF